MERARYRPVPGGRQIARRFRRKIDAERWVTEQQSRVNRGYWTAPELAGSRSPEWAETLLASKKTLKGRTYTSYESVWRTLVKPRWGDTRLEEIAATPRAVRQRAHDKTAEVVIGAVLE
jgi:hypothetical protein